MPRIALSLLCCLAVMSLASCASSSGQKVVSRKGTRITGVRTTAYTHSESDHIVYGKATAIGSDLKFGTVRSAAADWSVYPRGHHFPDRGHPLHLSGGRLRLRPRRHEHHRPLQALQDRDEPMGRAQCEHPRPSLGFLLARASPSSNPALTGVTWIKWPIASRSRSACNPPASGRDQIRACRLHPASSGGAVS
jgi:hypothetical protein